MLEPLFEQLIPFAEECDVKSLAAKAEKAKIPAELVKEIQQEAKWHPMAKKGLHLSAPKVAAKVLTKIGIPAGTQDEAVLIISLGRILAGRVMITKRLDKLIALANNPPEKKPNEQKKETAQS